MAKRRKSSQKKGVRKPQPASRPDASADAPAGNTGRGRLLAGIAIAVVVIAAVVIMLRPGDEAPSPRGDATTPTQTSEADDLTLREETFAVARKLVADFPENAVPLGLMGTVQNQFGHSSEAETWWRRCLEKDPTRADIYEVLAIAFLRKEEYPKVAELLEKAQSLDLAIPGVYRRYAEALLELGDLDQAADMMAREMEITPSLGENYIVLGKIYFQQREYEKSVKAYRGALARRPDDSRVHFGLATATARLGQREESSKHMARFQELRAVADNASTERRRNTDRMRPAPKILAEALVDAGKVYSANERYPVAEEYWTRARGLDPENAASRIQLINRYRATGRAQRALDLCRELTEIDPGNASYFMVTGRTLAQLGQFDEAEAAMRKTIELAPDDARSYRVLAEYLLRRRQNPAEAHTLAKRMVELAPSGANYYMLGVACSQNRDREGALAAMKRAAELSPENPDIQKAYQQLQETQ